MSDLIGFCEGYLTYGGEAEQEYAKKVYQCVGLLGESRVTHVGSIPTDEIRSTQLFH